VVSLGAQLKSPGVPAPGLRHSAQELNEFPEETNCVSREIYQDTQFFRFHFGCTSFAAQVATAEQTYTISLSVNSGAVFPKEFRLPT
jgi:hypothetical protein